jgi:hypothetical protein
VEALQRAFSRTRYLLRTLSERAQIDPGRRLRGDPKDSAPARRLPIAPPDAPRVDALLEIAAGLAALAAGTPVPDRAEAAMRLADRLLRLDRGSRGLVEAAGHLAAVSDSFRRKGGTDEALLGLAAAHANVRDELRRFLASPGEAVAPEDAHGLGALADERARARAGRATPGSGGAR